MDELIARDGMRVVLREIRADDAELHDAFIAALDPEDLRFRFGSRIAEVPRSRLHRVTAIDHEREVTIVATMKRPRGLATS